jgi:predicted 3-demethylubiquinone-9 3-methyltransferase (glyoxalase superfamily)
MEKITTCLIYNNQAEEAVNFYVSIFKDGRVLHKTYYAEGEPGPAGTLRTITFELFGKTYWAVNGGEYFKFTEAMSLYVNCYTQTEIDELWEKLSEGGEKSVCGWLKDKFGVSWQIAPSILEEIMHGADTAKADKVMKAVLQMKKLDIETIKRAYEE